MRVCVCVRECACVCAYMYTRACMHACVCVCPCMVQCINVYIIVGLIRTEEELKEAINVLLPESGYILCPGIPVEMYKDCLEVVRFHSKEVHCFLESPFEHYEAVSCLLWHGPPYKKILQCHPVHDSCTSCKKGTCICVSALQQVMVCSLFLCRCTATYHSLPLRLSSVIRS